MQTNLRVARLHSILGAIYVVLCLFAFGLTRFWFTPENGAPPNIVSAGYKLLAALAVLCVAHFVVAHGARANANWARIASFLIGAAVLVVFPIGTIFGVFILGLTSRWNPKQVLGEAGV